MTLINKSAFILLLLSLFSCKENENEVRFSNLNLNIIRETLNTNETLTNTCIFLYKDDDLVGKATNLQPNQNNHYEIGVNHLDAKKLIFITGEHSVDAGNVNPAFPEIQNSLTPVADFKANHPQLFYTGESDIQGLTNTLINIDLTRSLARLDITKATSLSVIIDSCVVAGAIDRSFILPGHKSNPASGEFKTFTVKGSILDNIDSGIIGLCYLYESHNLAPSVVIHAKINGIRNLLKVTLPTNIERNKRYEISIQTNGAAVYTNLNILPWGDGGNSIAKPENYKPKIDLANSVFPNEVKPNPDLDTIFIDANYSGEFQLALDIPTESEAKIESKYIQVSPITTIKSSYIGNRFNITSTESDINQGSLIIPMQIKSKTESQYYSKQITIVKKGYRTRMNKFNGTINGKAGVYDRYMDGLLAEITIEDGHTVSEITTKADDMQFDWLRTTPDNEKYLLEGAFKPNDTDARGQEQKSIISVVYTDSVIETFEISRKRFTLPVIRQGGLYWSKYNMRGNSKNYADQIGFDKDIPRDEYYEFLKNCSDEDFVYYAGATYKGKSTDGLYLKQSLDQNMVPTLRYEGYGSIPAGQVSNGPANAHCPDGFQMPNLAEWQRIWYTGAAMNLPGHGATGNYNSTGGNNRYQISRHTRNSITIDGVQVNSISFVRIVDVRNYTGEEMVFTGLGNQSAETTVTLGQIIFPVITSNPTHFLINYQTNKTSYGNLSNGVETRTIRCVKTPVSFIIP